MENTVLTVGATSTFNHPLIWPLLVEAIEDEKELEEQLKIEERYNLE
ncbi:hypothetical protein [Zooshikella harenae]|uniref:Uncharacterized protein n=1 Tax=Zooshikella harenae TaxID=2827238 RepID=A0ABS5ZAG6_9GAMM|nr:hypothetical protein [Zooshikella harenae]MBU2711051.1 hypothetical protein [Zooshikella harenae]